MGQCGYCRANHFFNFDKSMNTKQFTPFFNDQKASTFLTMIKTIHIFLKHLRREQPSTFLYMWYHVLYTHILEIIFYEHFLLENIDAYKCTNRLQVQFYGTCGTGYKCVEKFIYRILNITYIMCVHIVYQIIKLFFISQRCIGDQHPDCTQ